MRIKMWKPREELIYGLIRYVTWLVDWLIWVANCSKSLLDHNPLMVDLDNEDQDVKAKRRILWFNKVSLWGECERLNLYIYLLSLSKGWECWSVGRAYQAHCNHCISVQVFKHNNYVNFSLNLLRSDADGLLIVLGCLYRWCDIMAGEQQWSLPTSREDLCFTNGHQTITHWSITVLKYQTVGLATSSIYNQSLVCIDKHLEYHLQAHTPTPLEEA